MHVLTHNPSGSSEPAASNSAGSPLWRRVVRAGAAIVPAMALSLAPLTFAPAQASAQTAPIQHAVAGGPADLPIVEVQHYRHHHGPRGYYHRHRGPPPGYWGPPRHYRGHHRPPPHWRGPPPRGVWVPAPPPRYYYRSDRRHHDPGAAVAAGAIGLAAGAILGSALTAQAAPPRSDAWLSYCSSKYRSFDPASGTYLGYDGRRHACR